MSLDKRTKEAIDNYGGQIKTLKDFVTAVRTRPGMYLGPIGSAGFLNMIREIFQNSVDQLVDPISPCNWFSLYYDERTREVIVEDNGLGIPFDDLIRVLTAQHTSKNFEKKLYEYSSGLNGVGSKIVNALSETFIVESYRYDGTAVRVEFEGGYAKTKQPKKIPNKQKKQGLKTYFIPDEKILGDMDLEWKTVYTLLKHILSITPLGSKVDFTAIDIKGKKYTEEIINKDGIITDLIMKVKHPIIKPIVISADDGTHKLDCAFCYDSGDATTGPDDNENVTSFSNFCPTRSGTHVDGVVEGICRWFSQYMNNIYLANKKSKNKTKVVFGDVRCGLNIMIAAAHIDPNFTGQAKEILSNPDMVGFCKEAVQRGLDDWSKHNPQDLAKISKFIKDIAELRMKSEAGKQKIVTKYKPNTITGLPAKYIRPLGKKDIELIIVEGDSALGTVTTGRDKMTQGLFPIRGKITNAFKATKANFFNNEEVQGITKIILGSDYKRNFSIEDVKVSKVIFMADADIDGAHISALLERMFVMYFPQMIEAGMIYKAIPPLYAIKKGKKTKYFTEQIDIVRYVQRLFLQNHDMKTLKKKALSNKDITLFFMKNNDYLYHINKIAGTYAIEPYLLEMVLNHYILNKNKINVKKLDKEVNSVYRFMHAEKVDGSIMVKGVITKSNLIIFNEKFLADCTELLNIIRDNDSLYYLVNGKKMSLLEIMTLYDSATPNGVQRFKGLGEMDKEELAESTLYPGSDRTLVRYTMQDAKETLEAIREYESNSKKILGLVGQINREDLLD